MRKKKESAWPLEGHKNFTKKTIEKTKKVEYNENIKFMGNPFKNLNFTIQGAYGSIKNM